MLKLGIRQSCLLSHIVHELPIFLGVVDGVFVSFMLVMTGESKRSKQIAQPRDFKSDAEMDPVQQRVMGYSSRDDDATDEVGHHGTIAKSIDGQTVEGRIEWHLFDAKISLQSEQHFEQHAPRVKYFKDALIRSDSYMDEEGQDLSLWEKLTIAWSLLVGGSSSLGVKVCSYDNGTNKLRISSHNWLQALGSAA